MDLNLPKYEINVRPAMHKTGCPDVYDRLRKRYVALTPEEWVRQHFVNYLIEYLGYPESFMANEVGLTLNGTRRRCDTVVYDNMLRPRVIVEYKAPSVTLTEKVFDQIVRYNMVLRVRHLIVSNGMRHYCCRIDYSTGTYAFLRNIPGYNEITE